MLTVTAVIHRDLKPGNILVTKSGVKVLDFGLAKLLSRAQTASGPQAATFAPTLTQQGTILGTPRYMSPEQLEGREADQRSDIFAFGLLLYEMITGRPAFEGKTHANLIASIMTAEPKPVTSFQPLIPPALVHLIDTCLAKDPDDRQQTMHGILLELRWIACVRKRVGIDGPTVRFLQTPTSRPTIPGRGPRRPSGASTQQHLFCFAKRRLGVSLGAWLWGRCSAGMVRPEWQTARVCR